MSSSNPVDFTPEVRSGLTDGMGIRSNVDNAPTVQSLESKAVVKRGAVHQQKTDGFSWINFVPKRKKHRTTTTTTTQTPLTTLPAITLAPTDNDRTRGFVVIGRRLPGQNQSYDQNKPPLLRGFATHPEEENGEEDDSLPIDEVIIEKYPPCEIGIPLTVIWALLVIFASLMAIKEIFQLLQAPFSYVVSSENWGQWALIGSVTLTAWNTPEFHLAYWQYPAAAVSSRMQIVEPNKVQLEEIVGNSLRIHVICCQLGRHISCMGSHVTSSWQVSCARPLRPDARKS
jgi:hypothetical protein